MRPLSLHFSRVRSALLLALMCLPLAAASPAHAADGFNLSAWDCGSGAIGGEYDETGTTYIGCGNKLYIKTLAGAVRTTPIDVAAMDAAPGPDGSYVFVLSGGKIYRYNRKADGTYARVIGWTTAPIMWGGKAEPISAWSISTDGFGNLYAADGMWSGEKGTVAKFNPDGSLVTRFGMFDNTWAPEFTYQLAGVSASRDGRYVYTVEVHNQRVQRWVWQANGEYKVDKIFGGAPTNPAPREGWCGIPDRLAGPYALDVDPWGYVIVLSTTCMQVQKFSPDGTALSLTSLGDPKYRRSHYQAIDGHGNIYLSETKQYGARQSAEPGPWAPITRPAPDTTAPTLTQVTLPAKTATSTITIKTAAADNVGVTEIQFANDWDGMWGPWRPFTPEMQHRLYESLGTRGVSVRVRDAAGNESNELYRTTLYEQAGEDVPPPPPGGANGAPKLETVTFPAIVGDSNITVSTKASDDKGVTGLRFANEDGMWKAWRAYTPEAAHTLTAGYGIRGVFVQVRDAAGQESNVIYRTLKVEQGADAGDPAAANDETAPRLTAAVLPDPARTQQITIRITATDDTAVKGIRFANEDGNFQAWKPFNADSVHTLSPGYGYKAVFIQVRDGAGNESEAIMKRTICDPCTAPRGFAPAPAGKGAQAAPLNRARVLKGTTRGDRKTSIGRVNQKFRFAQRDRKVDAIDCGLGYDVAYVGREDRTINCERVIRRKR